MPQNTLRLNKQLSEVERLRRELAAAEERCRQAAIAEGAFGLLPPFVDPYEPYTGEGGFYACFPVLMLALQTQLQGEGQEVEEEGEEEEGEGEAEEEEEVEEEEEEEEGVATYRYEPYNHFTVHVGTGEMAFRHQPQQQQQPPPPPLPPAEGGGLSRTAARRMRRKRLKAMYKGKAAAPLPPPLPLQFPPLVPYPMLIPNPVPALYRHPAVPPPVPVPPPAPVAERDYATPAPLPPRSKVDQRRSASEDAAKKGRPASPDSKKRAASAEASKKEPPPSYSCSPAEVVRAVVSLRPRFSRREDMPLPPLPPPLPVLLSEDDVLPLCRAEQEGRRVVRQAEEAAREALRPPPEAEAEPLPVRTEGPPPALPSQAIITEPDQKTEKPLPKKVPARRKEGLPPAPAVPLPKKAEKPLAKKAAVRKKDASQESSQTGTEPDQKTEKPLPKKVPVGRKEGLPPATAEPPLGSSQTRTEPPQEKKKKTEKPPAEPVKRKEALPPATARHSESSPSRTNPCLPKKGRPLKPVLQEPVCKEDPATLPGPLPQPQAAPKPEKCLSQKVLPPKQVAQEPQPEVEKQPPTKYESEAEETMELRGASEAEAREMMGCPQALRNVAVVAHVDAGKSTLSDVLLKRAGLVGAGASCALDSLDEEKKRGITIKAAAVTLGYRGRCCKGRCMINLIDCPGHVDFGSEVTAALRVADGAFVVVDAVEGMQVQTEAVVKQCLAEKVVPTLVFNKIDRLLLQLQLSPDEMYERLRETVERLGCLCEDPSAASFDTECRSALGRGLTPLPHESSVCFTSGLQGWGFSIDTFARLRARKVGSKPELLRRLREKLWGDNFFNKRSGNFTTNRVDKEGQELERGFCRFVLKPIFEILAACRGGSAEELVKAVAPLWPGETCDRAVAVLKKTLEDKADAHTEAFHRVMRTLLPASEVLVELAAVSVPSPAAAQPYRADVLVPAEYHGGALHRAVQECRTDGPLVMYMTKNVPVQGTWNFNSFGRVFSGCIRPGRTVSVLEGDEDQGRVQAAMLLMGHKEDRVGSVPAGMPAAVSGLHDAVGRSGTVVDADLAATAAAEADAAARGDEEPIHGKSQRRRGGRGLTPLRHNLTPVVRAAVECVNSSDRLHLSKALKWLAKSDPLVECTMQGGREAVVAGAGELHLEVCLNALKARVNGPPGNESGQRALRVSPPAVPYRETVVLQKEGPACLAKTSNKLNRLYITARPLEEDVVQAIERGDVQRPEHLSTVCGWSAADTKAVWCLAPDEAGPNVLVNSVKGVSLVQELKAHVVSGFKEAMQRGPLCEEGVHGVRIDVVDAMVHSDSAHRGPAEVVPAARRAVAAAMLAAGGGLLEPILQVTAHTSVDAASSVRACIPRRRGGVVYDELHDGSGGVTLAAHLPVHSSFRLADELRSLSSGRTTTHASFAHWAPLPPQMLSEAVASTRQHKRITANPPQLSDLVDKL